MYTFSTASTPLGTSINATVVNPGDVISISGNHLPSSPLLVTVPAYGFNTYFYPSIYSSTLGNGQFSVSNQLSYTFYVTDYNPKLISYGGARLTITGDGFNTLAVISSPQFGDCLVRSVALTQIICDLYYPNIVVNLTGYNINTLNYTSIN